MKNLKLGIWIFALTVAEAALFQYIRIGNIIPSALFAFMISSAMMEDKFTESAIISMICATAASTVCGREFVPTFIMYSIFGIYVFNIRKKPRYMKKSIKAVFHTAVLSVITETTAYLLGYFTLDYMYILKMMLYVLVENVLMAAIIYPLLYVSIYKSTEEKRLIKI